MLRPLLEKFGKFVVWFQIHVMEQALSPRHVCFRWFKQPAPPPPPPTPGAVQRCRRVERDGGSGRGDLSPSLRAQPQTEEVKKSGGGRRKRRSSRGGGPLPAVRGSRLKSLGWNRSVVFQVVFDVLLVRVLRWLVSGLQQPPNIVVFF